jgi:putative Holliday junction resolvase
VRILGLDIGSRRIGVAISDRSRTLARPLTSLTVGGENGIDRVMEEVERLSAEEDGLEAIVVGRPAHLDGSPSDQTERVADFVRALARRTSLPIVAEDERLTSREAESRLSIRERDWRRRKKRLDAAAAAIILQDYLDRIASRKPDASAGI